MKIGLIQMDMKLGESAYNFQHAENLVRQAAKESPDVLCLPETWNVGSFPKENLMAHCDKDGAKTRELFGKLAKELNVNIIAGSIANVKEGKIYNTSLVFDRRGECIAEYDKTHLFTPLAEDEYFAFGNKTVTFELDGVKCGLIICYDVRFGELVRTLALQGIQILFVPAQWPDIRVNHWNVLNQARAIENQMFVACVNSVGKAGKIQFGGHSALIDPWGKVLQMGGDGEEIVTGTFDLSIIEGIRKSINVFRDRRPELYHIQ